MAMDEELLNRQPPQSLEAEQVVCSALSPTPKSHPLWRSRA